MSIASRTSFTVVCAALAACSDNRDTNRLVTAPVVRPAFSEAPTYLRAGVTVDGPFDVVLGTEASTQMAAAAQAATGGRAAGHVGFDFSVPFGGNLATESYSFVALATDPLTPLAAKGSYELMLTLATGVVQKVHGDVICMSIAGSTARIAGQITKLWINNVQRPLTGATHNFWTVTDNGEGRGTTDMPSIALFTNATNAQFHCATGFTPPSFANQEGNVQVDP